MGRKYRGAYIAIILFALRDILKTAAKKRMIQVVPEFELAGVEGKKRGRLIREEAALLFARKWIFPSISSVNISAKT